MKAISNPIVEGVIAKHRIDLVGDSGPRLQIETIGWPNAKEASEYAKEAEALFAEVAEAPTADGEESFADWLGQGVDELWISGGTIDQIVFDPDVSHEIKTRVFSDRDSSHAYAAAVCVGR